MCSVQIGTFQELMQWFFSVLRDDSILDQDVGREDGIVIDDLSAPDEQRRFDWLRHVFPSLGSMQLLNIRTIQISQHKKSRRRTINYGSSDQTTTGDKIISLEFWPFCAKRRFIR